MLEIASRSVYKQVIYFMTPVCRHQPTTLRQSTYEQLDLFLRCISTCPCTYLFHISAELTVVVCEYKSEHITNRAVYAIRSRRHNYGTVRSRATPSVCKHPRQGRLLYSLSYGEVWARRNVYSAPARYYEGTATHRTPRATHGGP